MSLDVALIEMRPTTIFSLNITHNLGPMAKEAGLYMYIWRPEEIGITRAFELIEPLTLGLEILKSDKARFEAFDSENKFGVYADLVRFVSKYLDGCILNPNAEVQSWR